MIIPRIRILNIFGISSSYIQTANIKLKNIKYQMNEIENGTEQKFDQFQKFYL